MECEQVNTVKEKFEDADDENMKMLTSSEGYLDENHEQDTLTLRKKIREEIFQIASTMPENKKNDENNSTIESTINKFINKKAENEKPDEYNNVVMMELNSDTSKCDIEKATIEELQVALARNLDANGEIVPFESITKLPIDKIKRIAYKMALLESIEEEEFDKKKNNIDESIEETSIDSFSNYVIKKKLTHKNL